jgi:eukaryotic-like serine/threonine-protein kinase
MARETLSHYRIKQRLGAGGRGEVYRVEDTRLGRDVALKLLLPEFAADPERLRRFRREAQLLAALDHPAIVTIFSVEEADGVPFLTMQLVDGATLEQLIPAGGLPLRRFFEIAVPLADAVAAAHAQGVIHRDLKPSNVMCTPEGRLKVLDFGTRPFRRDSPMAIVSAILTATPRPIREMRPDFPAEISSLLEACLRKDVADRLQSAGELHWALRRQATAARDIGSSGGPQARSPLGSGPSIAVLPFTSLSADPEDAFFADGTAEEVINALGRLPDLKVAARTSSFSFKGRQEDLRTIGEKLGVKTILEGSVRRFGKRLRITAQLVDASSGYHLWSEPEAARGRIGPARDRLAQLEAAGDYAASGLIHAALGEVDEAFGAFRSVTRWDYWASLSVLNFFGSVLDPLRADPRYRALPPAIRASWRVPHEENEAENEGFKEV